ncbi:hypothetical protein RRG08_014032 [Elysia crispata]|uniref:Uncharacterized protein n=1 Tax=Elysia crispata TaxID=231223 RepID=A0AAE0ZZ77_9GAST|nr:hypothetical protein RRG08_014032 [Elysia crispata]
MIFCRVWTHYFTVGRQVYSVQYGRSTLPLGYNDILQSMDALLYRWTTMIFCKVWTHYYTVVTQLYSVEYGRSRLPFGYNDSL